MYEMGISLLLSLVMMCGSGGNAVSYTHLTLPTTSRV